MATFELALATLRTGADHLLIPAQIDQLARQSKIPFRNTTLTPGNTLRLFAQQIAHGNVACSAVHHLAGDNFSDSAWCQARARLPIELMREVHRALVAEARLDLTADPNGPRWHGHRVYAVDGTNDSMPDTPELRAHYGVPAGCREGLGFPTSHLLCLMDHHSGLLIDAADSPLFTSDISQTPPMHAHLQPGDILLGDVAFAGWAHLALLIRENMHAVMPVHHRRIVGFAPLRPHVVPQKGTAGRQVGKPRSRVIKALGKDDQLVEYLKPVNKPAWMSAEQWAMLPESITVRELRRTVERHGFRPMSVTIESETGTQLARAKRGRS